MQDAVNALAKTTGTYPVPEDKLARDYTYDKDKFGCALVTPMPSKKVPSPGIKERPVVMDAELVSRHDLFQGQELHGAIVSLELRIQHVRIHRGLKMEGHRNRIDADKWKPMIMTFCELYELRSGVLVKSRLAEIEEKMYRGLTGTTVHADPLMELASQPSNDGLCFLGGRIELRRGRCNLDVL